MPKQIRDFYSFGAVLLEPSRGPKNMRDWQLQRSLKVKEQSKMESALIGIAKSVLTQLASPAMDELKLLWNYKTELDNLKHTITTISNVLEDAERQQSSNNAVRVWLERLKAALYDADDFFDTISANTLHYKAMYGSNQQGIEQVLRLPFSQMYHFFFMVGSAHKVKDIRKRIDAIAKDIRDFNFMPIAVEQLRPRRESTHSYVPSDEVMGREKEKEDIVKMLLAPHADQEGVSVIAVIGIGGLGKTTVAQLVYGDRRVHQGFDLHMWACINDFSCLDQVLLALLESLDIDKHNLKGLSTENLQVKLREEIKGKSFLLVLDNVWDEDPLNWRKLKILLDSGKKRSVVLATTRSVKVAHSMSAAEPYYHLQGISDESAWILFKKIAFKGKPRHIISRLEGLGQQIVNKCVNVPLLIVTIASFLRHQEESKWYSLADGELPTVVPGDYAKVLQALKISYREFPYPVKRCFAFCSLFPKDHKFDKDKLIRLWIAEGFVDCDDDEDLSLEDRAEDCYFYLVDMCFFQKVKRVKDVFDWERDNIFDFIDKALPEVKRWEFQMHELVHDLAKEVAGSESFSVDNINSKKLNMIRDNALRHVSLVGYDLWSFPNPKCNNVRTFLLLQNKYNATALLNKVMLSFKALRVLDLSDSGIEKVPDSIGILIHMRFLDLSHNHIEWLPSSICSLAHLQSLNLQNCHRLKELPHEIGRLISMRHLQLIRYGNLLEMPAGLAAMTSLVTLDKEVVHKHGGELRYLEGLNKLSGSLSILILETGWKNVIVDAQSARLSRKSRLKEITFEFKKVERGGQVDALMVALEPHPNLEQLEIRCFGGSKLPQWISGLDRLVRIRLSRCEVVELPPLSCIRSLKELSLQRMSLLLAIEGNISYDTGFAFFPSLETLELHDLPNLRGWWVQDPTVLPRLPNVINVSITGCRGMKIGCMPLFEPTVEVLELSGVKEEVISGIVSKCSSALRELTVSNVTRAIFEGFKSLTSLEKLVVRNFLNDGVEEGEATPWEFLQRLHTVDLSFGEFCSSTKGILDGVEHLTNCRELTLSDCRDLHLPWASLLSLPLLERLKIKDVERVIHGGSVRDIRSSLRCMRIDGGSADEWMLDMPWMSFSSLEELHLRNIRNLEALPQGIQHLSSLQRLDLYRLRWVRSLPCWISSLSSLNRLYSQGSSTELKKRCQKSAGEDWPLIQHIDDLYVDDFFPIEAWTSTPLRR